jgi:histone H3/H4
MKHLSNSVMPPRSKKPSTTLSDTAVEQLESESSLSAAVIQPSEATTDAAPSEHRRKKHKVSRRTSDLVSAVPTAVFKRLVREITQDIKSDIRWEAEALEALQVDAEAYMIERFGEANKKREMCDSRTLKKAHFVVA